jgi:formylglycine-generating enzyme required for sulfatase activity
MRGSTFDLTIPTGYRPSFHGWFWLLMWLAGACLTGSVLHGQPTRNATSEAPTFILVPAGTFMMGDATLVGEGDEQPVREVKVPAFLMAKHELTFREYDEYCKATWARRAEDFGFGRDNRPVVGISWYDAILYCNWRSRQEGLPPAYVIDKVTKDPGNENLQDLDRWTIAYEPGSGGYRLPTEAEWEYAARGANRGVQGNGAGSSKADSIAWYIQNARVRSMPVGAKAPNELGIHDLTGNVWEMCWDWHSENYRGLPAISPKGPATGINRTARGGSWEDPLTELRVSNRKPIAPFDRSLRNVGFRLVRTWTETR